MKYLFYLQTLDKYLLSGHLESRFGIISLYLISLCTFTFSMYYLVFWAHLSNFEETITILVLSHRPYVISLGALVSLRWYIAFYVLATFNDTQFAFCPSHVLSLCHLLGRVGRRHGTEMEGDSSTWTKCCSLSHLSTAL